MNHVSFSVDRTTEPASVRIEVDGRTLAELIGEVERPHAAAEGKPELAGSYVGLPLPYLERSPSHHFLGGAGSNCNCGAPDKTLLLGCVCGEPSCWPLMARITPTDTTVLWHDFEQRFRREQWSWEAAGTLRFERAAYEHALFQLPTLPASERL